MNKSSNKKEHNAAAVKQAAAKLDKDVRMASQDEHAAVLKACGEQLSKPAMRHLEMLADTKRAKPTRPVYTEGGYYDQSQLIATKAVVDFTTGTGNAGFILVNPQTVGVSTDRPVALYTSATSTWTMGTPLPVTTATGVNNLLWSTGALAPSGVGNFTRPQLSYRCVACTLYVAPIGSATGQNGDLYLWESDVHQTGGGMTGNQVAGAIRTRVVRGVQTGDPSIENAVNWHPKFTVQLFDSTGRVDAGFINDFAFRQCQSITTDANMGDTHICAIVSATSGTQYHAEIYAVYELVGYAAFDLKPRFNDPVGWGHIANALGRKHISGWVGKGTQVQAAYKHAVVQTAASADALEDGAEKELKQPVRTNGDGGDFFAGIKKLAPALGELAKEAVGFML